MIQTHILLIPTSSAAPIFFLKHAGELCIFVLREKKGSSLQKTG